MLSAETLVKIKSLRTVHSAKMPEIRQVVKKPEAPRPKRAVLIKRPTAPKLDSRMLELRGLDSDTQLLRACGIKYNKPPVYCTTMEVAFAKADLAKVNSKKIKA